MNEKIEIEEVLKKYDELGFDANQDYPGNFLWEELYLASPKERAKKSLESNQFKSKSNKINLTRYKSDSHRQRF